MRGFGIDGLRGAFVFRKIRNRFAGVRAIQRQDESYGPSAWIGDGDGNGRFRNPWAMPRPGRRGGFWRWVLIERPFKSLPSDPDPQVFPVRRPSFRTPRAPVDSVGVTWVGHSTTLLQVGGLNVLTDPIWSERASPFPFLGPRRRVPPGIDFEELPPIDLVLQSHNHYDHLDDWTVRQLAERFPAAVWLVPLGLRSFVERRGVRQVEELDWWEERRLSGLRIASTPARHFSGRGVGDRNASLWCSWAMESAGRRVYFAGDTGYHPEFKRIAQRCGPFDVALLPIGAYEPRWFMRPAHMNPEEAIQAFIDLSGDGTATSRSVMVAIHFATFKLTDEAMDEPPRRTRQVWEEAGLSPGDLWILAHGETRDL